MSEEGTTIYCGDNCNHTGPHRYPPPSGWTGIPTTPPASETVEAARAAIYEAVYADSDAMLVMALDQYEAAIRAEYEPDDSGFSPGCGPYNHPLTCKCPFVRRAEADERVRALLDPETISTAMNDAYEYEPEYVPLLPFFDDVEAFWDPFAAKVAANLRAALDAAPEDAHKT